MHNAHSDWTTKIFLLTEFQIETPDFFFAFVAAFKIEFVILLVTNLFSFVEFLIRKGILNMLISYF